MGLSLPLSLRTAAARAAHPTLKNRHRRRSLTLTECAAHPALKKKRHHRRSFALKTDLASALWACDEPAAWEAELERYSQAIASASSASASKQRLAALDE